MSNESIKFDMETLRLIAALEQLTSFKDGKQVVVKDCIVNDTTVIYVVGKGELGKAIGKNGANSKRIGEAHGKKIKIVEYSDDPVKFTENLLNYNKPRKVSLEPKGQKQRIVIEADSINKGAILGREGKNIQILKGLLKRHHKIEDVIVK